MGLRRRGQWLPSFLSLVAIVVGFEAFGGAGSDVGIIRFVKTPRPFSALDSAAFEFEVLHERSRGFLCSDCSIICKLDNNSFSECNSGQISYSRLTDGEHMFEACVNGSHGLRCDGYIWTVG
ncbi:hypothetical protein KSP40_PGU018307 [Platanthera guangdongensis]|uniref:Uncharacterized protein n=1 Tax=Platanthera guangdongensis TaxID=2320717 RepID=A0ABR2N425_9ASPA